MTAPVPNAALAYAVLDQIDAHPEQHDQSDFVRHHGDVWSIAATDMPCGTTACFAGWAVLLSGRTLELNHIVPQVRMDHGLVDVDDAAALLLGIGTRGMYDDPAHALFYAARTRDDLARQVAEIFGPRPCANCPPGYDCERGVYATAITEPYGSGCHCTFLGEGTPEHTPSALCRSLRPDAERES